MFTNTLMCTYSNIITSLAKPSFCVFAAARSGVDGLCRLRGVVSLGH